MSQGEVLQPELSESYAHHGEDAQHSAQASPHPGEEQRKLDQLQSLQIDRNILEGQKQIQFSGHTGTETTWFLFDGVAPLSAAYAVPALPKKTALTTSFLPPASNYCQRDP